MLFQLKLAWDSLWLNCPFDNCTFQWWLIASITAPTDLIRPQCTIQQYTLLSSHSRVFTGKTKILYPFGNSQPSSPQSLTINTSQAASRTLTVHVFLMSGQRVSTCPVVTGSWAVLLVKPMLFPGHHSVFRARPCCSTWQTFLPKTEEYVTVCAYQLIYLFTWQEISGLLCQYSCY